MSAPEPVERAVAEAHRGEWARVLAATVRVTRDLDVAEECVQDAYVAALRTWSERGVPDRPGAWLTTAARRTALNALRRRDALRDRLPLLVEPEHGVGGESDVGVPDDRLRLVFTCCHPALAEAARVALTLRLVCGVPTADVARLLLVPETAMAARLTRAKQKIAEARIPYRMPGPDELPARLDSVLTVIQLLYTAAHTAPSGPELAGVGLADRAVELAVALHELLPDEGEASGLLALLLVDHGRRLGRSDAAGELVLLADQDRGTWDRAAIDRAHRLIVRALRAGPPGRFTLQAAIASVHASAPRYAETDWAEIGRLYDALYRVWPSPVVALNRAISRLEPDGPEAVLAEIERIEGGGALSGYHYLPAAAADALRRLGRYAEAAGRYREALALTRNAAERRFLARRIEECGAARSRS